MGQNLLNSESWGTLQPAPGLPEVVPALSHGIQSLIELLKSTFQWAGAPGKYNYWLASELGMPNLIQKCACHNHIELAQSAACEKLRDTYSSRSQFLWRHIFPSFIIITLEDSVIMTACWDIFGCKNTMKYNKHLCFVFLLKSKSSSMDTIHQ